jgi:hypothetical protein
MPTSLPPLPPPLVAPEITRLPISPASSENKLSPHVPISTIKLIGTVVVMWSRLENALNDLIWTIEGKEFRIGRLETQDLELGRLLSALQRSLLAIPGPKNKEERKSVTNLINEINRFKTERNAVVHGLWSSMDGIPVVGSLRFDRLSDDNITHEAYPN